jgi:hypothetical protein
MKRLILVLLAVVVALVVVPSVALADASTAERHGLVLDQVQLYSVVIGVFSPIVGYIVNSGLVKKVSASIPEPVAAMVHVLIAAVGAAIYQAAVAGHLGFNDETLQVLLSAVVAAFAAHRLIWVPSGVQPRLAAGAPPS